MRHGPNEVIRVHGANFDCVNHDDCEHVKCRFGQDPDFVVVKGARRSSELIECEMPNYPQPDILPLEVSLNGQDFSNDGHEFGFFDPFVFSVSPKLISKSGNTRVRVKGFGFVDTSDDDQLRSRFESAGHELSCYNDCSQDAKYVSKNEIETATPHYSGLAADGRPLAMSEPLDLEVSVYGDQFTDNNVQVYYYEEPDFKKATPRGVPANGQDPILVETDFKLDQNDKKILYEYSNFTCRFHSPTSGKTMLT